VPKDPDCEDCRVSVASGAVDSIRAGSPESGFWKSVGFFLAVAAAVLLVICGGGSCFPET
jgi:hypothetical protein